jgi:mannose-6-phosphate isomerase-like protein (cupin superfamily)
MKRLVLACGLLAAAAPALAQDALYAWSPKPDVLTPYGKNKPVVRQPAVLAKHKGQARWSEQVVLTKRYDAHWVQAVPGDKVATQYYGDDRVVWIVWGGQIRFTIEGQQPFVASKGFLVEVPQRVRYSLETIGSEPSLRFEVTHTGILPVVAGDHGEPKPADPPGTHYMKVSTPTQPDAYDARNVPYIDFLKDVIAADPTGKRRGYPFVADEANAVNIIRGPGVPTPPASNRGHFHLGDDEFWFVAEGKIDYQIEGVKGVITADTGDVVYAAPGRYHRASWANGQVDTRIAFNVSPNLFHNFGPDADAKQ